MSSRTINLLKSLFGFIVFISCFSIKMGGTEGGWVYVGAILGLFICISYLRKAFDKYS